MVRLDGERWPLYSQVCLPCVHFHDIAFTTTERTTCAAFPDGIPDFIWDGRNTHRRPVKGDHGIQFERRPPPEP